MARLLLILLCCAPLYAVELVRQGDATLHVQEIQGAIALAQDDDGIEAAYTLTLRLHNPGEAGSFKLRLPQKTGTVVSLGAEELQAAPNADYSEWQIAFAGEQTLSVRCACKLPVHLLPHVHVRGKHSVEFPLHWIKGFGKYPRNATLTLRWGELPAAHFESAENEQRISHPVVRTPEAFAFEWYAATTEALLEENRARLDAFTDVQRRADNSAFTRTLVTLADLYELSGMQAELAEVCARLAALESEGGKAITHCGPWAKWRRHVPWPLRRYEALDEAARAEYAAEALRETAPVWQAYQAAKQDLRPFRDFPVERFGNFHDYDWPRVEQLYALAETE